MVSRDNRNAIKSQMDNCDENGINLRALRQMDGSIDQILLTCGQCAVYKFSNASNEWERKEIEGSMFVVRKVRPNGYGFVVINRLNTTNMCQSIDHNFDINITIPYLLYKNSLNEIFCIWFYNENDCKSFSQQLRKIIDLLQSSATHSNPNHNPNHNSMANLNPNPNDILKKLLTMDLNCDDRTVGRSQPNGQNSHHMPSQPQPQPHPHPHPHPPPLPQHKLSLGVQQLFSQVGTHPVTAKPMPSTAHTFEEELITPASLMSNQTSKLRSEPNEAMTALTQRQSPIILNQNPIPMGATSQAYNQMPSNYLTVLANKDKFGSVATLTMEQLKQTLIHLLSTDADFLHSIHSAYIHSIHK